MNSFQNKNVTREEHITVESFFEGVKDKFKINLFSEIQGFERLIKDQNLHRPGLALAGFVDLFTSSRIQVFGNTEIRYLEQLSQEDRYKSLDRLFRFDIPCLILTTENKPCREMQELAAKYKIAVFTTPHSTTKISYLVSDYLDDQFAPRMTLHGSFVDVYGVGMLFVGKSGIGKSEVALDLVERGHRLVADDVVILTKKGEGILMGAGTELAKHFMEVRGVGFIDVQSMFGIRAIRFQKRLEVVIELELWDDNEEYTRTGLDDNSINLMEVEIPYVKLPIVPGKNITVIAEVIALNYLLKHYGYDSAKVLQSRLLEKLKKRESGVNRAIDYFEHDFE